jgi:hypothetical protein
MLRLELEAPRSHLALADALHLQGDGVQAAQLGPMHRCMLRIFELGQQQRSDLWTAHGATRAISLAACRPLEVGHAALAAALATFGAAEAALGRCRRLLPYGWVHQIKTQIELSRRLLPAARDQLRLLQQQAGISRGPAGTADVQASGAAQRAFLAEQTEDAERLLQPRVICDGCRQKALGLRRCSRCRQAQYCRSVWIII